MILATIVCVLVNIKAIPFLDQLFSGGGMKSCLRFSIIVEIIDITINMRSTFFFRGKKMTRFMALVCSFRNVIAGNDTILNLYAGIQSVDRSTMCIYHGIVLC